MCSHVSSSLLTCLQLRVTQLCAAWFFSKIVHVSLLVSLQHIEEEYVPDPPILIDLVNEAKLCSHGDPAGSLPVSPKYITIALSQSVCGPKAP